MTRPSTPQVLVCNRLNDMTSMHPQQDDTHVCSRCHYPVGIYPSSMRALKRWPDMAIVCMHCAAIGLKPLDAAIPSAETAEEFEREARETKRVVRQ